MVSNSDAHHTIEALKLSGSGFRLINGKIDTIKSFNRMQKLKINLWDDKFNLSSLQNLHELTDLRIGIASGPTINYNVFAPLKRLDIYRGECDDEFLQYLVRVRALEELRLFTVDVNVSEHGWTYLANVIGLKKFGMGKIDYGFETKWLSHLSSTRISHWKHYSWMDIIKGWTSSSRQTSVDSLNWRKWNNDFMMMRMKQSNGKWCNVWINYRR